MTLAASNFGVALCRHHLTTICPHVSVLDAVAVGEAGVLNAAIGAIIPIELSSMGHVWLL